MKKILISGLISLFILQTVNAQLTRYIVFLKNKGNTTFTLADPAAYLSQRAIDRRTRHSITIDSSDMPVSPAYLSQLRAIPNLTVLNSSKWLNAVTFQTSDAAAITAVNALPFVQSVRGIASRPGAGRTATRDKFSTEHITELPVTTGRQATIQEDFFNYGTSSYNEIHLHNGEFLHNIGLRGQGMQIAVLDGGFYNYTSLKAFDSIVANGQVLSTWDFVSGNATVTDDHPHGMQCLSTIAANIPGQFIGKAPKASFHLFRSEDVATEYPIEEHNWVCAAERADSAGADVISSSLGYYDFDDATLNYTYSQMDGNTTIAARGADVAAKKGLLVFNSVGNEGGNAWNYLSTPSDGDSVLAVGAVNTSGVVGSFSSYGPSADGQVKPDMASIGVAAMVQTTSNTIGASNGTSFACPNMAGLGTCLWQAFPEYSNMKIAQALRSAGNKYSTPDDRTGYGIPDMKKAFGNLLTEFATAAASVTACEARITWNSKDVAAMRYEIERKGPGESAFTKVGELNAQAGDLLTTHTYQYTHSLAGLNAGTVSYRIKQLIDTTTAGFTGVFIDTVATTVAAGCLTTGTGTTDPRKERVVLQPNPVGKTAPTLLIETPYAISNLLIRITDSKGALIYQQQDSKPIGAKTIVLPVLQLQSGIYYITVYNSLKKLQTLEVLWL